MTNGRKTERFSGYCETLAELLLHRDPRIINTLMRELSLLDVQLYAVPRVRSSSGGARVLFGNGNRVSHCVVEQRLGCSTLGG